MSGSGSRLGVDWKVHIFVWKMYGLAVFILVSDAAIWYFFPHTMLLTALALLGCALSFACVCAGEVVSVRELMKELGKKNER